MSNKRKLDRIEEETEKLEQSEKSAVDPKNLYDPVYISKEKKVQNSKIAPMAQLNSRGGR